MNAGSRAAEIGLEMVAAKDAEIDRLNAVFKRECDLTVGLRAEVERLQAVKRRTLAIADERAVEAVRARAENKRLRAALVTARRAILRESAIDETEALNEIDTLLGAALEQGAKDA